MQIENGYKCARGFSIAQSLRFWIRDPCPKIPTVLVSFEGGIWGFGPYATTVFRPKLNWIWPFPFRY